MSMKLVVKCATKKPEARKKRVGSSFVSVARMSMVESGSAQNMREFVQRCLFVFPLDTVIN